MKLKPNTRYIIHDLGTHLDLYIQTEKGDLEQKAKKQKPKTDIHLSQDTHVQYLINWQDQTVDRKLVLHLDQPDANAEIIGMFIANQDHQITLNSTIAHHAPRTTGNCLIKGVLTDQAQASLSGMIQIDHSAPNSQDQLTERLLVLSPQAIGQLQPELEILTDDVIASHATTISKPDPEQLFYLQSRGVNSITATSLLIEGFLQEIKLIFSATF